MGTTTGRPVRWDRFVGVKFSQARYIALAALAERRGTTVSALLREAAMRFLDQEDAA